jgi:hypothetical protein
MMTPIMARPATPPAIEKPITIPFPDVLELELELESEPVRGSGVGFWGWFPFDPAVKLKPPAPVLLPNLLHWGQVVGPGRPILTSVRQPQRRQE